MRFLTHIAGKSAKTAPRLRRARRLPRRYLIAVACAVALLPAGMGYLAYRTGWIEREIAAASDHFHHTAADYGFAVANVEVEGRQRASREAILSALGVERGTPILAIDPAAAKRRLESIAWVRSAAVERRLPDTLHIRLVERQPLAFWQRNGKLTLVDRDGVTIPTERLDAFTGLIVLVGEDAAAKGAALLDMLATEPNLSVRVTAAVRVGGRRWNLRFDNGIDVELPEEEPASAWHRLAELERNNGILQRDVQVVDLRLPDRLVVRVAPDQTKPPPKKGRQPGKTT